MGIRFKKAQQAPGGGGITGAINGLSINGTDVELGDTALYRDTTIPTNGFRLALGDEAGAAGNMAIVIDNNVTPGVYIGDTALNANGTLLTIDDANEFFTVENGGVNGLQIDFALQEYRFGKTGGAGSDFYQRIEGTAGTFKFGSSIDGAGPVTLSLDMPNDFYWIGDFTGSWFQGTNFHINDATRQALINTRSGINIISMLSLDFDNQLYRFGDSSGSGVGADMFFEIDGVNTTAKITKGIESFLFLDIANAVYAIGDYDGSANGTFLQIQDASQRLEVFSGALAAKSLSLDSANGLYQLGDIDAAGNNLSLTIDDTNLAVNIITGETLTIHPGLNNLNKVLFIDIPNETYQFGDISGVGTAIGFVEASGTYGGFTVNTGAQTAYLQGAAQNFEVQAANGIKITGDASFLLHTGQAMTDGAGAGAGTLTNAPVAGDPTKWIAIDDNGTTRWIPTWEGV